MCYNNKKDFINQLDGGDDTESRFMEIGDSCSCHNKLGSRVCCCCSCCFCCCCVVAYVFNYLFVRQPSLLQDYLVIAKNFE